MKIKLISIVVLSVLSVSAMANESFGIMNDRLGSAIQDNGNNNNAGTNQRVHDAYNATKGAVGGSMDTSKASPVQASVAQPERNTAADAHNYANTAARSYNAALTAAKYGEVNQVANYGVKNDPTGSPVAQGPVVNAVSVGNPVGISATAYRAGITQQQQKAIGVAPTATAGVMSNPAQSINVAASTLHPDTAVSVSINGVTQTTTAGALAAVNPAIQVAVPHVPAFQRTGVKGGRDSGSNRGSHVQGDNNGQNNAHDHAMGRADGVGGHSQFR